jgi:hypothetical protein
MGEMHPVEIPDCQNGRMAARENGFNASANIHWLYTSKQTVRMARGDSLRGPQEQAYYLSDKAARPQRNSLRIPLPWDYHTGTIRLYCVKCGTSFV